MKLLIIIAILVLNMTVCCAESIYDKHFKEFNDKLSKYETVEVINNQSEHYICYILNLIDTDKTILEAVLLKYNNKCILIETMPDNSKKTTTLLKRKSSRET